MAHGTSSLARVAAVGAVVAVLVGWGAASTRGCSSTPSTIDDAAGARATLWALVVVFGIAAVRCCPSLAYLFWLTQRSGWARRERVRESLGLGGAGQQARTASMVSASAGDLSSR